MTVLAGALLTCLAAAENPHQQADWCRRSHVLSESCRVVCLNCHRDDSPPDIYWNGDVTICAECHNNETDQPNRGTLLLQRGGAGGGNHPSAIDYNPETSSTVLSRMPVGPKFFFNEFGGNPRVYCSSCHDAMSSDLFLLRVPKEESALCVSCHDK